MKNQISPLPDLRSKRDREDTDSFSDISPQAVQDRFEVTSRSSVLYPVKQGIGSALLRFCLGEKKTCSKTDCWVQPICACAREDLARSRRIEARLWIAVAVAAGIVIIFAVLWAQTGS